MNKSEAKRILEELEIRPAKKLGQNFLVDDNMLNFLIRMSAPEEGECILEIGPGLGVLTKALADMHAYVVGIEIDSRLVSHLQKTFKNYSNVKILQADACRTDIDRIMKGRDFRCIANLPYSSSTPLMLNLIQTENPPREMFLLLQEEVADRLAAGVGTKSYGALSVEVQLIYQVKKVRKIPPSVFYPVPEINSVLTRLKHHFPEMTPARETYRLACRLAKHAFSQRRKKAFKLLKAEYDHTILEESFQNLQLHKDSRAEDMRPATFLELAMSLNKRGINSSLENENKPDNL